MTRPVRHSIASAPPRRWQKLSCWPARAFFPGAHPERSVASWHLPRHPAGTAPASGRDTPSRPQPRDADRGPMRQYYVRRVRRHQDDERNDHEADGDCRRVLRRRATNPGVRGCDPGAFAVWTARQPPDGSRRDAPAEGVLRSGTRRPGRRPSRLRSLRGEAGAEGRAARRADAGARGGRGKVSRGRRMAHGGGPSGQPLLGSLPVGARDERPRLRAGGRGRTRQARDARNVAPGWQRGRVPSSSGEAARVRPRCRRAPWRVSRAGAVAPCSADGTEGSGVAARLVRARRPRPCRGGGRCAAAGRRALGAGGSARHPIRGRTRPAFLPLDAGANAVLRHLLCVGALGAYGRGDAGTRTAVHRNSRRDSVPVA